MKNIKYAKLNVLCLLLVLIMFITGCQSADAEESISETRSVIGTIVSLQLFGTQDRTLLEESYEIIEEIDDLMSLTIETSELNALNANAGKGPFTVSDKTFYVIQKAVEYGVLSKGGFDISLEPVISLWKIGSENPKVPSQEELTKALGFVDYSKIKLNEADLSIELEEGMSIDLGGIAKGYAADLISAYLKENDVTKAILNLGGNILIIGEKEDDTPFRVGIQNPFGSRNDYFGVVEVVDKTIVTSGVYERNFEQEGITYHHILDTKTGFPINNGVASVSIIADMSIDADALSTVLFVLGVEEGIELINQLDGVEGIYVTNESTVIMSEGAEAMITITAETFSK